MVTGSMVNGCLSRLNNASEEKAFCASNTLLLLENTKIKNETDETYLLKK